MTYVTDMRTRTSEVVILHAQDLAAGPVATIHIPYRVPIGFHGNWIPDSQLEEQRKVAAHAGLPRSAGASSVMTPSAQYCRTGSRFTPETN